MNMRRLAAVSAAVLLAVAATFSPAFAAEAELPSTTEAAPERVEVYQIEDALIKTELAGQDENAPVLKDVRVVEQGSQTLIVKTWDIPPAYDPELLVEADFEKNGFRYKKAYLLSISENYENQTKLASETVTVSHKNKADALGSFQPILEYDEDGFTGQLTLQADAIVTEATGQNSYSYAVTDTREYTGFERNDTYNVPKTVEKDGVTLELSGVDWKQSGEGGYTATASYQGTATGISTTGYISTGTYMGEVSMETLAGSTYAVVYEGSQIPAPPPDYLPYYLAAGIAVVLITVLLVFWNRRNNTKVYAMSGKEFQLVHRQRVTALAPIIDLTPPEISSGSEEFMVVMDVFAARKMKGQLLKIVGKDGVIKELRVTGVRNFHIRPNIMNEEDTEYDYQG